jgi:hypothetical protein
VEMMGFIGMGNNPMVGATVQVAVAIKMAKLDDPLPLKGGIKLKNRFVEYTIPTYNLFSNKAFFYFNFL